MIRGFIGGAISSSRSQRNKGQLFDAVLPVSKVIELILPRKGRKQLSMLLSAAPQEHVLLRLMPIHQIGQGVQSLTLLSA